MIRFLAAVVICLAVGVLGWRSPHLAVEPAPPEALVTAPAPELTAEIVSIRTGDTLADLLDRAGLDQKARVELIAAATKEFDVRKLRAGAQLALLRSAEGVLEAVEYGVDADHKLEIARSNGAFVARIADIPGTVRPDAVCGTLQGSLFASIARAGEDPELAVRLAELFAWDLDFYRDPREGDRFCVLIEKKEYEDERPATYQRVLAASYNNAGTVYDAYLFGDEEGRPLYYSSDGQSLQAAFLRSPIAFDARISSRFSRRRFHPVLKTFRAHPGTDYAVPAGTSVRAVASGRVTFSARSGGSGNLVTIRHANGFETQYLHLSRRLVKKGDRVQQGHRIGLVGSTGLATGPHLDLRVQKNGRYLNWETLKAPRESSIRNEQLAAFAAARDRFRTMMTPGYPSRANIAASDTTPEATP